VSILIDSGVRRGVDIVKALALGARAVAIGRATLYGAAAAGEAGAERALGILTDELRRAMQLCGTPTVNHIDAGLLHAASMSCSDNCLNPFTLHARACA
jgi:isopentenyl diphosphate isomerase/L-lactate dehydrogenase-like FMN-dependent dehydrogenase